MTEHEGCEYYWFKTSLLAWLVAIGRGDKVGLPRGTVDGKVPGLVFRLGSADMYY